MKSKILGLLAVGLLAGPIAAIAVPVLEETAPVPTSFTYDSSAGFFVAAGSGIGDVTASLWAVDLFIPSPFPSASSSGCEAADFAGFAAGSIALIQRGTCSFGVKAANAFAAGALGVLLFNEGNLGRTDAIGVTLGGATTIPVFFASFAIGDLLRNGVSSGSTGVTLRMKLSAEDLATVPEPGSLALLGMGLAGLGLSRRRKAN